MRLRGRTQLLHDEIKQSQHQSQGKKEEQEDRNCSQFQSISYLLQLRDVLRDQFPVFGSLHVEQRQHTPRGADLNLDPVIVAHTAALTPAARVFTRQR